MPSRLSVQRHDIAALWSTVARLRIANGDSAGAEMARWQAKQFRTKLPAYYQYRSPRR